MYILINEKKVMNMRERKEGTEDWREEREERKGCNDISISKNPKETSKEENRRLEWKLTGNWISHSTGGKSCLALETYQHPWASEVMDFYYGRFARPA